MTNKKLATTDLSNIWSSNSGVIPVSNLTKRIKSGQFKIAIFGLGHVGAPMASAWLRAGAHVIGVDKSPSVIQNAIIGKTHVPEPGVDNAFSKGLDEKRFDVYKDPVAASYDSFFKMICVPVLASNRSADLAAVKDVASAIGRGIKKGDVVSLNASVPPGTTEDIVLPIIEKESEENLRVESDFYMIYNPERIYEGRAIEDIENRYPAIISGVGSKSLQIASEIYSLICRKGTISMSSIKAAETEKLLEGVYRDANIALANELAKYCEKIGVDFWEAREAANSQPFCHLHKPGIGVGGACIPVYPQFIIHSADKVGIDCRITKLARTINDSMPVYAVQQATQLLNRKGGKAKNVAGSVVTLLGIAFRGGVSDTRLSPTYAVIKEFQRLKARQIRVHDPLVKRDEQLKYYENVILTSDLAESLKGTDLILIVADHPEYSHLTPEQFLGVPVYDGRGLLDKSKFRSTGYAVIGAG